MEYLQNQTFNSRFRQSIHVQGNFFLECIFFFFIQVIFAIVRCSFLLLNTHFPFTPIFLFLGIVTGSVFYYLPKTHFQNFVTEDIHKSVVYVMPIIFYKFYYTSDFHRNGKNLIQSFYLGIFGVLLSTLIVGIILGIIYIPDISLEFGFVLGMFFVPMFPTTAIQKLRTEGPIFASVYTLLEGITMSGLTTSFLTYNAARIANAASAQKLVNLFAFKLLTDIMVGWVSGVVICKLMLTVTDPLALVMVVWFAPFTVSGTLYFGGSFGYLSFFIIIVMISKNRFYLRREVDQLIMIAITVSSTILSDTFLFLIGMFVAKVFCTTIVFKNLPYIGCLYIVVISGRFMSNVSLTLLANRFLQWDLNLIEMVLVIWCGVPNVINILLVIRACNFFHKDGFTTEEFTSHITGLVIVFYVINVWSTPYFMSWLGYNLSFSSDEKNMKVYFRWLMDTRRKRLLALKMERLYNDAHWLIVKKETEISHPSIEEPEYAEDVHKKFDSAVCDECNVHFTVPNTMREYQEMSREARKRVLQAEKKLYIKQHQVGMLSEDALRFLIDITEKSMEKTTDAEFNIEALLKRFEKIHLRHDTKSDKLFNSFEHRFTMRNHRHLSKTQRRLAKIVTFPGFDLLINISVLANFVAIIMHLTVSRHDFNHKILFHIITGLWMIYAIEMMLKIYILSTKRFNGIVNYFKSSWNRIDFFLWIIITSLCIHWAFHLPKTTINIISILLSFRFVRIFKLCPIKFMHRIMNSISHIIDKDVSTETYEIGKAFLITELEIMSMVPGIVRDPNIIEKILAKMCSNMMEVSKQLEKLQKNQPQLVVNVKTRQVILYVLNSLQIEIYRIKVRGFIEESDYELLLRKIYEKYTLMNSLSEVPHTSPDTIFREIPWLGDKPEVQQLLYENLKVKHFSKGDIIINQEQESGGIYIILDGSVKEEYIPSALILELLERGVLPVIDYIENADLSRNRNCNLVPGNTFGEFSVLAGKPHSNTIIADSFCLLYFIESETIREAIKLDKDPIEGLEARMWKALFSSFALKLFMKSPHYCTIEPDEVFECLDRSFVPNLNLLSVFIKTELVDDIILLEGIVWDNFGERYIAPCLMPRRADRIYLRESSSQYTFLFTKPKLFIKLAANIKPDMVMEQQISGREESYISLRTNRKISLDKGSSRVTLAAVTELSRTKIASHEDEFKYH